MTNPTYPGVYMQEVSSGVRPITSAGTSVTAFIGSTERGPVNGVKKIFNFIEYQNIYGGFIEGSYLAQSVYYFFNNGGTQCYIGRVLNEEESKSAECLISDRSGDKDAIEITATSPGEWGNTLGIQIDSSQSKEQERFNRFNLRVYKADATQLPEELESYLDLSMDPDDEKYAEKVINGRSLYILFENNTKNPIQGYSESGLLPVKDDDEDAPILTKDKSRFRMRVNGGSFHEADLSPAFNEENTEIKGLENIKNILSTYIEEPYGVTVELTPINDEEHKHILIKTTEADVSSKVEIMSGTINDAAAILKLGRRNGGTEVFGSAMMRPADSAYDPITKEFSLEKLDGGEDGHPPLDQDYINAFSWLDTIDDVSLIAVPGVGSTAVIDGGLSYCRNRSLKDCFFIADAPLKCKTFEDIADFRELINTPNSYGALYYPWLKTLDPSGRSSEPISAPPSGFIAGLYARIDAERGVWKAPAGTEAMLNGTAGLDTNLTDQQHGDLNLGNKSVCVIRRFPGSGNVVWGSRTLSSDPEYRYIPVRRMAIMLRKSIYSGIQWAVFEPNDQSLWAQLRLNINSFMMTLFRQGAFYGATPAEAFFVKCDNETTSEQDIIDGIVNISVGFRPQRPAEFVVVRISQKAGQS